MSKSQRVRLREVRAVFRLIGECREQGWDVPAWRAHFLTGINRLVHGQVIMGGELYYDRRTRITRLVSIGFDEGWETPDGRALYYRMMQESCVELDPIFHGVFPSRGKLATRHRSVLVGDREWYRSRIFNDYVRRAKLDLGINSYYRVGRGTLYFGFAVSRPLSSIPLGERERRLIELAHSEVGPLVGRGLASETEPGPWQLSPRLRETLDGLLEGDSEKQLALRLKISRPTAHEYVTAIYRHFDVSSRPELMAMFLRRYRGLPRSTTPPAGANEGRSE